MLQCECGKEFNNSQSFNGHKSNCSVHLIAKYGNLDSYRAKQRAGLLKATQKRSGEAQLKREAFLADWIAAQHTCVHCGKLMTEMYGSGQFCSIACANSRGPSSETKTKISKALSGRTRPSKATTNNTKARSSYLQAKRDYLAAQLQNNEKVLAEYKVFLQQKINNRVFIVPKNAKRCGEYLCVGSATHPRALKYKTYKVNVHILLAEELLGRYLTDEEVVHHINEDKLDNRFENILIFDSKRSHARFHYAREYVLKINNDRLICEKLIYPDFTSIS